MKSDPLGVLAGERPSLRRARGLGARGLDQIILPITYDSPFQVPGEVTRPVLEAAARWGQPTEPPILTYSQRPRHLLREEGGQIPP